MSANILQVTSDLAHMVAAHAVEAVGPEGVVVRVDGEDASLARATFISRIAEAATCIANGEPLTTYGTDSAEGGEQV